MPATAAQISDESEVGSSSYRLSGNTDCYQPAEQKYPDNKEPCWKYAMNLISL